MDEEQILAEARAVLDGIDDEIHALVLQRWQAVHRVAQHKRRDGLLPLRPHRERTIYQRLLAQHQGTPLAFEVVLRMFQEMIAAYTQAQSRYQVEVLDSDPALFQAARDQYGHTTPIAHCVEPSWGEAVITVLPPHRLGWLVGREERVFDCVPMHSTHRPALGYAVGRIPPPQGERHVYHCAKKIEGMEGMDMISLEDGYAMDTTRPCPEGVLLGSYPAPLSIPEAP